MNDYLTKIFTWIKANWIIVIGLLIGLILILFPKLLKFGGRPHADRWYSKASREKRKANKALTKSGKRLPRSVGKSKTPPVYNKDGSRKKPWQIAGSPAARRHMAEIRARR